MSQSDQRLPLAGDSLDTGRYASAHLGASPTVPSSSPLSTPTTTTTTTTKTTATAIAVIAVLNGGSSGGGGPEQVSLVLDLPTPAHPSDTLLTGMATASHSARSSPRSLPPCHDGENDNHFDGQGGEALLGGTVTDRAR